MKKFNLDLSPPKRFLVLRPGTDKNLAEFQIVNKINGSVHIFYGTALNLLKKCGGLPTAATMKGSFSEV